MFLEAGPIRMVIFMEMLTIMVTMMMMTIDDDNKYDVDVQAVV